MSEATDKTNPLAGAGPEGRNERWVKYGLNVLLTSLMVVILAVLIVWTAQRYRTRGDLTSGGSYSLKPQTVTVIGDIKSPVKVVALYPRLKQEPGQEAQQDFYQPVDDILQEYARKGKNIEVESIDPVSEPAKLDKWLVEVMRRYGGNVKDYSALLTDFPKTLEQIKKIATGQAERIKGLSGLRIENEDQAVALFAAINTVNRFPTLLSEIEQYTSEELKAKMPDYKGLVTELNGRLTGLSRQAEAVKAALEKVAADEKTPQNVRDYAKQSVPDFEQMKKLADEVTAKVKGLGELKLDEVRRRLVPPEGADAAPPAIAVMGENDIKLIDFKDVWTSGQSTGLVAAGPQGPPRLRFAGEQQLTAAILSLSQPTKTKIVFIRAGGEPKLGGANPMMGGGGAFSEMAARLRAYNFEVIEKDVSGQSQQQAMQRAMMGGPPPNEPGDEEIKDAIWVVFSEPQMTQFGAMPGGPELENKLKEHLDRGGSAMVLFDVQGGDLNGVLKEWGVAVRTNTVAVHEPVRVDAAPVDDFIEDARRQPPIFVINEFGGPHPVTSTLQSLDAALVPMLPVEAPGADGAQVTRLLPVPQEPRSWGETDLSTLMRRNPNPKLEPLDMPGPLYAGAAVTKKDKGRLVVIGSSSFANNLMLTIPDQRLARQGVMVSRFPGNGELFTNSVFWLAGMDKMIALSPSALDTPRIQPMSAGVLAFWRWGVLLTGLPVLALTAGLIVWNQRKD